jgi:hypothetical protein
VVAPAAGTIVHVKMSSSSGCGSVACVDEANYVVIDHGDGTQTTMLHLAPGSLDSAASCGTFVRRGQRIARTGSTGWSTGNHLHVERDRVRPNLSKVCECGPDGLACGSKQPNWHLFWPSAKQPNVPVTFQEWGDADAPGNRRGLIGPSTNVDQREDIVTVSAQGRLEGWSTAPSGGRSGAFSWAKADGATRGTLSLKGAGVKPGTYEVWGFVPLSSEALSGASTGSPVSAADTVVRVKDAEGVLDTSSVGGAYHPIKGLERVQLTGDEDVVFGSAGAAEGRVIVADTVLLRRVQ